MYNEFKFYFYLIHTNYGAAHMVTKMMRVQWICRCCPKFMPACEAPLLLPACSPITVSLAFSCSSLNSRTFLSASFGNSDIVSWPFFCAILPNA